MEKENERRNSLFRGVVCLSAFLPLSAAHIVVRVKHKAEHKRQRTLLTTMQCAPASAVTRIYFIQFFLSQVSILSRYSHAVCLKWQRRRTQQPTRALVIHAVRLEMHSREGESASGCADIDSLCDTQLPVTGFVAEHIPSSRSGGRREFNSTRLSCPPRRIQISEKIICSPRRGRGRGN